MQYRTLGRTGLSVSDIGFGAMTIGGEIFGATDDQESLRAVHRAIDLGLNFIDTADAYGRGHSEELLAQVLKDRRDEVILATKGGNQFTVRQGLRNFEPDYITSALENSLKRMQIDTIDLYQLHNPSPEIMQRGEIFERLDRLKQDGKIRFYGVSLEKTQDGIVAIETGKPDTLQVVYNILHQDPQEALFPLAEKEQIGIIARVPLERGVLSGRFQSREEFYQQDWRRGAFPQYSVALIQVSVLAGRVMASVSLIFFWGLAFRRAAVGLTTASYVLSATRASIFSASVKSSWLIPPTSWVVRSTLTVPYTLDHSG